jgi:DNA-binding response OmpR family regulator
MPNEKVIVLVVEDEILLREMIADELRDAGFEVLEAADGDSAARLLAADGRIDVLFTDIRLPGALDGWGIAQLARERRAALPVIYASGYAVDRSGAVPHSVFVDKPYRPSQVVATIRRIVG